MELTSLEKIKKLLQKHGVSPSKGLGQNFLISKSALKKIVGTAQSQKEDIILEIGPGLGILTQELAKKVKKVLAVEKDQKMCKILKETLNDLKNIEVIKGDILKLEIEQLFKNLNLKTRNYKVVANLPYYITAPVIRKLLETKLPPKLMVLMAQKEVAQRICAKPPHPKGLNLTSSSGAKRMNLLAISVQLYAKTEIIAYISRKSFWPIPKVDAAIIKITPKYQLQKINDHNSLVKDVRRDLFFKIVKAGFSQPRKQLVNNLSKGLRIDKIKVENWLNTCNIKPNQRAETLSLDNWILLTKKFVIMNQWGE